MPESFSINRQQCLTDTLFVSRVNVSSKGQVNYPVWFSSIFNLWLDLEDLLRTLSLAMCVFQLVYPFLCVSVWVCVRAKDLSAHQTLKQFH